MRNKLQSLLVGMLGLVIACGDDGGTDPGIRAHQEAQQKWEALGLAVYTVEARQVCYCRLGFTLWHELTVADGVVIASRLVDPHPNGEEVPPGMLRSVEQTFQLVDEFFADESRWRAGERVSGSYDPATGLPLSVSFAAAPGIADGGFTFYYRALKPGLTLRGHQ